MTSSPGLASPLTETFRRLSDRLAEARAASRAVAGLLWMATALADSRAAWVSVIFWFRTRPNWAIHRSSVKITGVSRASSTVDWALGNKVGYRAEDGVE